MGGDRGQLGSSSTACSRERSEGECLGQLVLVDDNHAGGLRVVAAGGVLQGEIGRGTQLWGKRRGIEADAEHVLFS